MTDLRKIAIPSLLTVLAACACLGAGAGESLPKVRLAGEIADGRPAVRWRGFNLVEMFYWFGRPPDEFREEDFQIIRDWGFNFVRLPLDYRFWIKDGDWERIDESALGPLDRAVELGRKYGIHVCICLHRCPGYTVAQPAERQNLFESDEAQRVCCRHWAMLARRYRGISNGELSFNLMNEPSGVSDETYGAVAKKLIEAIRREDPKRFVISDGLRWGRDPVESLVGLPGVGQAMRGYDPTSVTHYLTPWMDAPSEKPVWPLRPDMPRGALGGASYDRIGMAGALTVDDLPAGRLTVEYGKCFGPVTLEFAADGRVVKTAELAPVLGDKGWYETERDERSGLVSGYCRGKDEIVLTKPVKRMTVRTVKGQWASLVSLTVASADGRCTAALDFHPAWGRQYNFHQRFTGWEQPGFKAVDPDPPPPSPYASASVSYLYETVLGKWDGPIAAGTFAFCGEFGVWKKTPHRVALSLMRNYLWYWKSRDIGWALWNLRGENGVLDSGREDVAYEDFRGHRLDRKMLELLQAY